MAQRQAAPGQADDPSAAFDGAFRLVVVLGAILIVLMMARILADAAGGGHGTTGSGTSAAAGAAGASPAPSPAASVNVASFLDPIATPAPALDLTGPDGQPVSLAALRGVPVLVFFGYTHCPDVCPATIGTVGLAIDAYGQAARAIFVSIDPERDTVPWLAEFVRYMPKRFTAVTGTPTAIKATANDWGVRYAKVETGDPAVYSMSHTADVFLVDAAGQLRARFPFGTQADQMTAVLRSVAATTPSPGPASAVAPTATPTVVPTATPSATAVGTPAVADISPQVISSSVWAGGSSPAILSLSDTAGTRINDPAWRVTAQLLDASGDAVGAAVQAVTVQPRGVKEVSFVPTLDIPSPGRWRLAIEATDGTGAVHHGVTDVNALDPGGSAALGQPAPTVRTPTGADFGGDLTWVSTDPLPDPRLSQTSTADALASGTPFMLVADSSKFKVTPVCGRAVVLAKGLIDRWPNVPFIHLEPYKYTVITTEPVLQGTLAAPTLTDPAAAWGIGAAPWGIGSMPWVFIVDSHGIVRAKYQGVVGSVDLDVILSMIAPQPAS